MAKVVAVTGGIGSGKSEVCKMFAVLGVPVIDLDVIARAMSAPGSPAMQAVREVFGAEMFEADGSLHRANLRALVFSNPDALEQLNGIMHPAIRAEAIRQITAQADQPYVVLAIPLLVESRQDWSMIDHVMVVDCDEQTQLERVLQRNQLSAEMVQAMMAAQSSREQRLAIADTVLDNQSSLQNLHEKVVAFHKNFSKTCQ